MANTKKIKTALDWACMECGKRLTLKQAQRAFSNVQGCPKCGGADIDCVTPGLEGSVAKRAADTNPSRV